MTLFRQKFRIESTRLPSWDYSTGALYYITLCVKNRHCVLGDIVKRRFFPSSLGIQAEIIWREIPQHATGVRLDAFVIMPNHIHGIIGITDPDRNHPINAQTEMPPKAKPATAQRARFGGLPAGSLSKIVQGYKSAVTRWCHLGNYQDFVWQPRFYEHIIRDQRSLLRIRDYIFSNPATWHTDEENPHHLA